MTRTIAVSLVALVLLLLASSLPVASATTVGPVEAAICIDESGGGHAHIDALIEPLSSPVVGVTSAARCLGVPTLVPKVRPQTRGVLRL